MANTDESLLYVYNRTDEAGFVVVAGDDGVEKQIVAFSHDNKLQIKNLSDGARYLLEGWCKQISAARSGAYVATRAADASDVGKVEVLYETALWNQGTPFNNEAPVIGGYRSVTGCVATAMSIICYHNKWPEKGVGTTPSYKYLDIDGNVIISDQLQDAIDAQIEQFITALVEDGVNRISQFEDLLEDIPHDKKDIQDFMINYHLMYNNFDDFITVVLDRYGEHHDDPITGEEHLKTIYNILIGKK